MRRLALVLALTVSANAWADAHEAVQQAFEKFLALKSFRATVVDVAKGQQLSAMEYVAPDRYHMKTGQGPETLIVGDEAWMDVDGRLMKMPIPVGRIIAQYRNEALARTQYTVTEVGTDSVDGEPAHVYSYTLTQPVKAESKAWISDRSGLPLQIESRGSFMGVKSTTRVRYSDFDDPSIRIAAPAR